MHYFILSPWNKQYISNIMFYDLKFVGNVSFNYLYYSKDTERTNKLTKVFNYVYDRRWLSKRKRIDKMLHDIVKSGFDDRIVIMTNEMLCHVDVQDLRYLKENNVKTVLLLIDPLSARYKTVVVAKKIMQEFEFDLIYTFEREDAEEYGYEYCNTIYSAITDTQYVEPDYDICYIGNLKNRITLLQSFWDKANENRASILMKVFGKTDENEQILPQEAFLNSLLDYNQVIELTRKSNTIFEMVQEGQTGVTFRFYEAVVYNKKLLTNNNAIVEMPFYDARYMKIYKNIQDIDWEWVKERAPIDYNYQGEFSSINLLRKIDNKLKK